MRTNRTPFTDVCELVKRTPTRDSDGYETSVVETKTEVFCSIIGGVARTEMYEALRSGIKLSATAEIWEDDYDGERILKHETQEYSIVRVYPSGHGTLELSLEEVTR